MVYIPDKSWEANDQAPLDGLIKTEEAFRIEGWEWNAALKRTVAQPFALRHSDENSGLGRDRSGGVLRRGEISRNAILVGREDYKLVEHVVASSVEL